MEKKRAKEDKIKRDSAREAMKKDKEKFKKMKQQGRTDRDQETGLGGSGALANTLSPNGNPTGSILDERETNQLLGDIEMGSRASNDSRDGKKSKKDKKKKDKKKGSRENSEGSDLG